MEREVMLAIRRSGLIPVEWIVLEDLERYLIIKNKLHGEIRVINK